MDSDTKTDYSNYFTDATPKLPNQMPTYQQGADGHNYGNGNFALTDPSSWGTGLGNAGKFIATATVSGLSGLYNSGVAVANWVGADAKSIDIASAIGSLDDNLGKYYAQNKSGVDTAGFIVSSFIPGLGGIKLLNAGQKALRTTVDSGVLGANLSKATGLLAPQTQMYTQLAKAEIATSSATLNMLSGNAIKAVASGYGQAALEATAFELAVAATNFKTPMLDSADGLDIAKNIALGAVTGGIIGGAITHAFTYGAIKFGTKIINPAEKLFTDISDVTGLSPAQRIIERQGTISNIPNAPSASEILSGEFKGTGTLLQGLSSADQATVATNLSNKLSRIRDETNNSLQNKIRKDLHELTSGADKELANHLADVTTGLDSTQVFHNFEHLTEVGRLSTKLAAEKDIDKFIKDQKTNLVNLTAPASELTTPYKLGYVKLSGEDLGKMQFETPTVTNIADTVKSSGFQTTRNQIDSVVDGYKFKPKTIWDASAVTDHVEAEARYLWVDSSVASGKLKLTDGMTIGEHDIPMLEAAIANKLTNITVASKDGNYIISGAGDIYSENNIYKHLMLAKQEVSANLLQGKKSGTGITVPEIAKITNVRNSFLAGEIDTNKPINDYFARQMDKASYGQDLKSKGLWTQAKEDSFPYLPSYAKVAYDTKSLQGIDGNLLTGMAYIKGQQKLYQQGIDTVFATHAPKELQDRFWHPGDEMLLKTNKEGAGPGIATFANGGYNTPASWAESIGSATAAVQKSFKNNTTDTLAPHLYKLASNPEAAIEFEAINKHIQSTSELYGLNSEGTGIEPLKLLDWKAKLAKGSKEQSPVLQEGAKSFIPIANPDTLAAWGSRVELTGSRTQAFQDIRNAQGLEDYKDPRALRAIRHDPKDYPYYAIVTDPTVTGVGHKSMIHAASEKELTDMISKVPSKYEVYKGDQLKQHFDAHGEFDYERTLHENYIDGDLRSNGVNNPFFSRTDPQKIAQALLKDHLKSDDIFARELVNAKYEKEFSFLRQQGDQFTNAATSKYTGSYRQIENTVNNPYLNYVKTALNISQVGEHPLIQGVNTWLDTQYSKIYNTIRDTFSAAKSPADLDNINNLLTKYGVSSGYRDAATDLLANHTAPKGELVKFVSRANSIMSTLVTRLDFLNPAANAIGSTVLYGSETKSFLNAMKGVNPEIAGVLGGLLKTPVASSAALAGDASADTVTTAGKLMINAIKNFTNPESVNLAGEKLKDFYLRNGWTTRLQDQFHQVIDNISLTGTENVGTLNSKINNAFSLAKKFAEKGEVLTGNKLAEEFNRFISADTMRQMTDLGIKAGRITSQEQLGYINSFVNRTQGNMLASQRPLMFQGALGQAIGLFQTFQFNTMQQLFRHVSEGSSKDAAMLLGLQGTMYGMNGLPAFNFLNTHILGTMSGNPEHQDLYTSTYGIAGKSVGDLLLYGLPSNMLRGNLYTRGDINPRQLTVIPANPLDIPIVNATIKAYDNVKNTVSNIANGGNIWQSFLQGIEHNGLSRPLAGIAQTFEAATHGGMVFSTTGKGNISGANDLFSWATAIRLSGGRPIDDAIANDAVFRVSAYQASDRTKMDALKEAINTAGIEGNSPTDSQETTFAQRYASIGGKQIQFNKFMMKQILDANTNKANKIMDNLKNPYSQKMQQIMGGADLLDGRNVQHDLSSY